MADDAYDGTALGLQTLEETIAKEERRLAKNLEERNRPDEGQLQLLKEKEEAERKATETRFVLRDHLVYLNR